MKLQENLNIIYNFFANNFEIILYINFTLFIMLILLLWIVNIRDDQFRHSVYLGVGKALLIALCVWELFAMGLGIYIYWANYKLPRPGLHFFQDVVMNTRWIKDDFPIYFIDEKNFFT